MRAQSQEVDGGPRQSAAQFRPRPRGGISRVGRAAKRVLLETAGWLMFLGGLAAIPLPGPGLLITFAGLLLLSRRHSWAERRVDMVRLRALKGAAQSVATWPRLAASSTGAALILSAGVAWIASPPTPQWWPLAETWWLPGGSIVGVTQLASGVIAISLLGYSYRRFHGAPKPTPPIAGDVAGQAAPPTKLVATCAVARPNCLMGECHEVLCECLCTSAA